MFLFLLHTKQFALALADSGRLSQAAECAARPQPMILFLACIYQTWSDILWHFAGSKTLFILGKADATNVEPFGCGLHSVWCVYEMEGEDNRTRLLVLVFFELRSDVGARTWTRELRTKGRSAFCSCKSKWKNNPRQQVGQQQQICDKLKHETCGWSCYTMCKTIE